MMLQLRPFSLVAIVGALIGAIAPAPAAATAVDTRCYLFFPDEPNLTRSYIGLGVGGACQLHCIATLPVVLNGEITGSVDIAHEVAVDDCDTTPVLRFHPDFVRGGSPDSELRGALDRLEDEAVAAVVALHELPPTDVSRARHVFGYGRGAMRTAIGARVFEIAQKAVGERTADEQRIADRYADEVKRMRVAAIEFAIAEYERWEDDPCGYTAPEGFSYTPQPGFCSPSGGLINLFDTPAPPSKDDLLAYGAVEVRRRLQEPAAALAMAETTRFSLLFEGLVAAGVSTLVVGGLISAGLVAGLTAFFSTVFPFAIAGSSVPASAALAGSAAAVSVAAVSFGVVLIVLFAIFVGVLQGFFVFTEAAIPIDLQAALQAAQVPPVLSELVEADEGKQELFEVFMLSTLPDFRTTDEDLPDPDQDFSVRPEAGGGDTVTSVLQYVGWDGQDWETKLSRGWFLPRLVDEDLSTLSLFIEFVGCDGESWNAARVGHEFLLLRSGGDPASPDDASLSDELCYRGSDGTNRIARLRADATPPEIASEVAGTLGDNGWYVSDVAVEWDVVDEESAILWQVGCGALTVSTNATRTLTCRAESSGGANADSVTIKRDATPPVIVGSASGLNAAGWSKSSVQVSFSCADATSGVDFCSAPIVYANEVVNETAPGTARDRAGNSSTTSVGPINIDKTPPRISGLTSLFPNAAGWFRQPVLVSFACSDALSGVRSCTDPVALSAEGAGQRVDGHAVDVAGNIRSTSVDGINIDATPPSVTVSSPADGVPTYLLNELVTADWEASDGLSGLADATGSAASGTAIDTGTIGMHVFTVTAHDRAGNVTTVPRSYEVIDNVAAFDFTVDRAMLSTWRRSRRDNGFLVLAGQLSDPSPDGTFLGRLLGGEFELVVRDGDGSFDVETPLTGCRRRGNGRVDRGVICRQTSPKQVRVTIVPDDGRDPLAPSYQVRLSVRKISSSETGPSVPGANSIEGPVTVALRRGSAVTSVDLSDCTQRGYATLLCRGPD